MQSRGSSQAMFIRSAPLAMRCSSATPLRAIRHETALSSKFHSKSSSNVGHSPIMVGSFRYHDEALSSSCWPASRVPEVHGVDLRTRQGPHLKPALQCVGAPDPAPMIATTAFVLVEANCASAASFPAGLRLVFQFFRRTQCCVSSRLHGHRST